MRVLGRLGFVGRVIMIVLALSIALVVIGIALSSLARERRETGTERFPVPAQAAAIVELLEATPRAERPRVLRAVSSESFVVRLAELAPDDIDGGIRMPGVEWLVAQYFEALESREVIAYRWSPEGMRPVMRLLDRIAGERRSPVAIAVRLRDGGYTVIELRGDGTRRVFGIPIGFWIGLLGSLLAALAVVAIIREARPLGELARSVEAFADSGAPHMVVSRGAPEIRRLIASTNAMQTRIAALIKGRTMLLGAISHDLKTYITRLRLRAEMIEPEADRERAVRDLEDMTALIDDALAVARGAAVSDRRETVDLARLVADQAAERHSGCIDSAEAVAVVGALVSGDPVALRRVFANLVDNATRHASHCRVSLCSEGAYVVLIVEDDGPGIPHAEREAVFEPFYRLDRARPLGCGNAGLGLAIARQIVEAHAGTITLDRSAMGGARFCVRLPTV
jgi:signal transduction histidine kinase